MRACNITFIAAVFLIAAAGLLSRIEAGMGAGVGWGIEGQLESGTTGNTDFLHNHSDQNSSEGEHHDFDDTFHKYADGSSSENSIDNHQNPDGSTSTWTRDSYRDPSGNRTVNERTVETDRDGNRTTKSTTDQYDNQGRQTSHREDSKHDKVEPPKPKDQDKKEPPKEKPEEEKPKPPAPGGSNPPQPEAKPKEGLQVTLNLQAACADCLPGRDVVSVTASGVLPRTETPAGVVFVGKLPVQSVTAADGFSCKRTYYHEPTKKMVGGQQQLQIQKQNPSASLSLIAMLPGANSPIQMPQGLAGQQQLMGSIRIGPASSVDAIQGGQYDRHSTMLEVMFGNAGQFKVTPALALTREDLTNGFQRTFSLEGTNVLGWPDSGEYKKELPYQGTAMGIPLKTTGQLSLQYKGGGSSLPQPPTTGQEGQGQEILGMTLVTAKPNTPGGARGALVTGVDRKRYGVGPGGAPRGGGAFAVAQGDIIVEANGETVTCVEDFQRAVSQAGNQPLSVTVMRSGARVGISLY